MGLVVDDLYLDGTIQRVPVEGKKASNRAGAYCLRDFILKSGRVAVVGFAQNHVTGHIERFTVSSEDMTVEERNELELQNKAFKKKQHAETKAREYEARARAIEIWDKLPESGKAPYLFKKKVRGYGLKYSRDSVVVPVRDIEGRLKGLQFIDAEGGKKFLTGTAKRGCFHLVAEPDKQVGIAEGYATAASIYQITGIPTAAAFDAGNLLPVALAFRERWPEIEIIIFGDDDRETEGNPGRTKAMAAAKAVNGKAVFPELQEAE